MRGYTRFIAHERHCGHHSRFMSASLSLFPLTPSYVALSWETPCDRLKVMAERLGSLDSGKVPPLLLLPMYSQLPADLQAKIFDSAQEGVRK